MKVAPDNTYDEPEDDPAYDGMIRFTTEVPMVNGEPSEYLLSIYGALFPHAESKREIGRIQLQIVQCGRAFNEGQDLFEVYDCVDQSLYEHADAVLDCRTGDYREGVFEGLSGLDLMVIESISVEPKFRGRDLGLMCIKRAIDAFGAGLAGVVLKPFPPQFSAGYRGEDPRLYAGFGTDFAQATKKLRTYYQKLGFHRVGRRSAFYVMDLSTTWPELPEQIAG